MAAALSPEALDVVVLCGGRGTRLGTLTADTPKPLLPVGGVPFLLRRLTALNKEGFSHFLLAAHYRAEQFRAFATRYADRLPGITVIEEPSPLGTGGALRHAAHEVRSAAFVALNGDSWGTQLAAPVLAEHARGERLMTMVLVRAERVEGGARAKGLVSFGPRGELLGFATGDAAAERWVNAGLYVLDRELVRSWPEGSYDLEQRVMSLVPHGLGYVFCSNESLLDIGTPDCYERANFALQNLLVGTSRRITFGEIEIGASGRRWLAEALDRNWVSEGPNVQRFEAGFAKRFGYRHAIATSSGTDAGSVAMSTLLERGAKRGDEVITPALSFVASANCILTAGLTPAFVDVELDTLNINPVLIEAAITSKTRAIQVVHTMGKVCKMDQILTIAKRHHLWLIEDCCEAHGATLKGKVVGSFGAMGLFSFYAAHIICSGEGGMISTSDPELAALCRSIRSHGRRGGQLYFHFDRVGFNSKMNDLEAAIGLEGLELFDQTFAIRRRHLARLWELLSPLEDQVILYPDAPGEVMCPHAFPLVLRDERQSMEGLHRHLEARGIQCKTLFGSLPTQHGAFTFLGYRSGAFPVAERIGRAGLHFGVHQYLTDDDIAYVVESIKAFFDPAIAPHALLCPVTPLLSCESKKGGPGLSPRNRSAISGGEAKRWGAVVVPARAGGRDVAPRSGAGSQVPPPCFLAP